MSFKVGVYVDAENIRLSGGFKMRYDVLRRFAERDTGLVQRLNTYIAIDRTRWDQDPSYKEKQTNYLKRLREFGWYIDEKEVKRFRDEEGNTVTKANADMELAIDALIQSDKAFKVIAASVPWDFKSKGDSLDTWNGYREEREELFSYVEQNRVEGVVLLSADRHRSDAYRIARPNGYDFHDLMSSHLTKPAAYSHPTLEDALFSYNRRPAFGLLTFDMAAPERTVRYQIVNIDNDTVYTLEIPLRTLRLTR